MSRGGPFDRIVCGVDPGGSGAVAACQAARLLAPGGTLLLVAVIDEPGAVTAAVGAEQLIDEARDGARARLAEAAEAVGGAEARTVDGRPEAALIETAASEAASLLVVGSHGRGLLASIVLGSVAATLVRDAPCSVMVARPTADDAAFPRSIVVGVDGSPPSLAAARCAAALAERVQARVRAIAVDGDDAPREAAGLPVEPVDGSPADALVDASRRADLAVVGHRGLHGVRAALGSVSERVARSASCSVLVVR
jgi:nucleotide-binding universal stress UspA family protein